MRSMLDNLREDLGISAHESYREDPEDVGMGSKRPKVRSSSKTTGYTGDSSQFRNIKAGSLSADRHGAGLLDGNHWTGTTDSRGVFPVERLSIMCSKIFNIYIIHTVYIICVYVCARVSASVRVCECACLRVCVFVSACMCACECACLRVCVQVCVRAQVCGYELTSQ